MIVREVLPEEKKQFNSLATHPLQAWEWGEFREKTGKKVIRLGAFDDKKLKAGYQLTFHPISKTGFSILYFPRGPIPDKTMLKALTKLGQQEKAILVKMEPNIEVGTLKENLGIKSGRPFFYKYTFQIDLSKTEKELLTSMHPKTRYNIHLADRHGVEVAEDNSDQAHETFIKLYFATTRRQKFYGHTPDYYRKMKEILVPTGMEHLFLAKYKSEVLAAYIFFTFKDTLYYPYGASSRVHREVMPTYALIWEAIKFGKKMGFKTFDLWGCLGPKPNRRDPWFGFHRFKAGFGGELVEFIGTYDLIINPYLYPLYNFADEVRWKILKLKTHLPL